MIIDFSKLNLREPRLKREAKNAPAAWSTVFDCGHQHVLSDEQIHNPAERKRYGDDLFYCANCANGDRSGTGDHGFCTKTVFHKIEMATPLFGRHLQQIMESDQEQQQHEQH